MRSELNDRSRTRRFDQPRCKWDVAQPRAIAKIYWSADLVTKNDHSRATPPNITCGLKRLSQGTLGCASSFHIGSFRELWKFLGDVLRAFGKAPLHAGRQFEHGLDALKKGFPAVDFLLLDVTGGEERSEHHRHGGRLSHYSGKLHHQRTLPTLIRIVREPERNHHILRKQDCGVIRANLLDAINTSTTTLSGYPISLPNTKQRCKLGAYGQRR